MPRRKRDDDDLAARVALLEERVDWLVARLGRGASPDLDDENGCVERPVEQSPATGAGDVLSDL